MIVLDASAIVLALLNDGDARGMLSADPVAAPHLADAEVASALRARDRRGEPGAGSALEVWRRLGVQRFPASGLLGRVWELRSNLTAYDATYVALAEALGCALVTADSRIARAPGPTCTITVVRR